MADFFISCCRADAPRADVIFEALTSAGYTVHYYYENKDDRDRAGTNFWAWMFEKAEDSDRCLAIWSTNFNRRDKRYSAIERDYFLDKQVQNGNRELIPVLLEDCEVEGFYGMTSHIRFDPEDTAAFMRIIRALPSFEQDRPPGLAEAPAPRVTKPGWPEIRSIDTMESDHRIFGRDAALEGLRVALNTARDTVITNKVTVAGQGGLGKTTLARAYARVHRAAYRGIVWVAAEREEALLASLGRLADALKIPAGARAPERARAALEVVTLDRDPWLVIFDNAESYDAIKDWLPEGENIHLIVTTRDMGWPTGRFTQVAADLLPYDSEDSPAVDLLMDVAGRREDRAGARDLAEALGGLPLALVIAGGWIGALPERGFADYAARLEDAVKDPPPGDYPDTLLGAVRITYEALGDDARAVLDLFAWLAPEGLSARLVTDVADTHLSAETQAPIPPAIRALAEAPERVEAALIALTRRSVLNWQGGAYALHRMTGAAVRALQGQAGEAEAQKAGAAAVLAAVYPGGARNPANYETWPDCQRLTPHVAALVDRGDDLPPVAAMDVLLNQASLYLRTQAAFGRAVDYAKAALDLRIARLPPGHVEIAIGWGTYGSALEDAGRLEEAVAAQEENVRFSDALTGQAARKATAHNNLGTALEAMGRKTGERARLERAAEAYRVGLFIDAGRTGIFDEEAAIRFNNLSRVRGVLGHRALALAHGARALRLRRALLTPDNPSLSVTLNNLGALLLQCGAADRAEPLLAEALEIRCAAYGRDDHPWVVNTARWLAQCRLTLALAGEDTARREGEAADLARRFGFDLEEQKQRAAATPYTPGIDPMGPWHAPLDRPFREGESGVVLPRPE